jgi:hypothetical protein
MIRILCCLENSETDLVMTSAFLLKAHSIFTVSETPAGSFTFRLYHQKLCCVLVMTFETLTCSDYVCGTILFVRKDSSIKCLHSYPAFLLFIQQ